MQVNTGSTHNNAIQQDWGVQQKKANRSSEKNRKKLSAPVVESRLTNDISPESTPGAGRRRARTPHSFPHVKYTTQMSVPDQAELDKLRQRINFTDMDEVRSSRVVAMNTRLQLFRSNLETEITAEELLTMSFGFHHLCLPFLAAEHRQ